MKKIVIGARASNLAQIQANLIKQQLLETNSEIEIEIIPLSTKGDQRLDINWKTSSESLKGLFTTELEQALLLNKIDIAVHSLKDMPTEYHEDLCIAAYVNQEDERDAFVSAKYDTIEELPLNAVVGTSAIRRELQLKEMRNDLNILVIRGNIETRINKMLAGEYDAIILAAAGLIRTNNTKYMKSCFEDNQMISASGQGILCLETRENDQFIKNLIAEITEEKTMLKAKVERTFSQIFDGGCTTPMGCNATIVDDRILFKGMYYAFGTRYDGYVEGFSYEQEAIAYRLSNQIKNQYISEKGHVYLVGAGPGNYELLTLKAHRLLKEADCILYDRLISNEILDVIKDECKLVYVGKENHEKGLSQSLINEQLINAAFDHKIVVRLKSGDPFIFGRGFEEIQAIKQFDIPFEIVPGVSSFIGASAYSGIPLTDRHHSSSIHIFSGHGKNNTTNLDYQTIAKLNGTLIFFMSIRNIKDIVTNLIECGKDDTSLVAFIENASTGDQRVIIASFEEILTTDIASKVKAPAIIVMGGVVNLNQKGEWFNKQQEITLLSTRENKHFDCFQQTAKEYKFASLSASQIEVKEVISSPVNLDEYDIILFNSANGVKNFIKQYPEHSFKKKIIGAVGLKTKELLEEHQIKVTIMPKVFNMEKLLESTVAQYQDEAILIVGSSQTKLDISKWQRRMANKLYHCITYDTTMLNNDFNKLKEQINQANVICFFSESGVIAFTKNIKNHNELLDSKKIASIGPYTSKALQEHGLVVDIEAQEATQDGLIKEIKEYYNV